MSADSNQTVAEHRLGREQANNEVNAKYQILCAYEMVPGDIDGALYALDQAREELRAVRDGGDEA